DRAVGGEAVGPAMEGQLRFAVVNLGCEGCDSFGQYVRRIGNNDVKAVTKFSDRIEQITVQELNPFCDTVPPGVDLGDLQSSGRKIHCPDLRFGQFFRQSNGDRTTTGTDVKYFQQSL